MRQPRLFRFRFGRAFKNDASQRPLPFDLRRCRIIACRDIFLNFGRGHPRAVIRARSRQVVALRDAPFTHFNATARNPAAGGFVLPWMPRFFALVCGGALLIGAQSQAAPAKSAVKSPAKPAAKATAATLEQSGWNYQMADEPLEARWSFRATLQAVKSGEARVVFGWKDARNFALLRVTPSQLELWSVNNGIARELGRSASASGQITLQIVGARARVLRGATIAIAAQIKLPGAGFGTATRGGFAWDAGDVQPTEDAVFRDDFMRAQGPDDAEVPSEWRASGNWKTSGALGPKSDAALNPNPFVFRASYAPTAVENVARAGRWFWSDYALTTSIRATDADQSAPLVATIEAFAEPTQNGTNQSGVRGEIDFHSHTARLMQGDTVLAQSAPFETGANQWHRVRLEPGPGTARLVVDGIERVAASNVKLAQGEIALRSRVGSANFVDYDDVRVGPLADKKGWGEGTLPERFQKDRLMKNWASAGAAWKRGSDGVWWHTGDFFGASTVTLPLPELKDGEGIEIAIGAKMGAAGGATNLVKIERTGANVVIGAMQSAPLKTLPLAAASGKNLTIATRPNAGAPNGWTSQISLGDDSLGRTLSSGAGAAGATKIGVVPLQNGVAVAAPAPRKIAFDSATFEREGRAVIGVNITPVTPEIARQSGLPDASGAIVDNVEPDSPATAAGVQVGDVVVGIDGARVTDVDSMRAAVGAVKPGARVRVEVLRATRDSSGLNWENVSASTPALLDYSFTSAPTDWRAARGRWEVAERWTCSPQWSFFSGQNSDAPLLWSRFQTKGDWTLEAYLATPMDLSRGERSPSDLNITVGGDGKDISSGYSFGFATDHRAHNTIWRGDQVALEKPFEMPPGAGETHQDWFYVRLERRQIGASVRFKWSVNGRELATYTDANPLPDGGHLAFWSLNGGLSIARMRLWNSGLVAPQTEQWNAAPAAREISNALGNWSVRGAGEGVSARLQTIGATNANGADKAPVLRITNPQSGGDWTTYVTRQSFVPALHPTLEWDYKMPGDVKLNLYAKIDGQWREIVWSGGKSDDGTPTLGAIDAVADGQWHRASFDLLAALRAAGLGQKTVEALAFAAPDQGYLRAGIGGNPLGASWELREFRAPALVAKAG